MPNAPGEDRKAPESLPEGRKADREGEGKRSRAAEVRRAASRKERFDYWFDCRMSRGSLSFVRMLIAASVLLAVLIAGVIILLGFNEDGDSAQVLWDSVATIINAWMPYYEDGGPGYLVLMSVVAIAGVLFTSVLIGIVTSAIEEKINELNRGNSRVLEAGHTVVLGFYAGEYTLLRQLLLAAGDEPSCIVVADEQERDEMEQAIRDNLDVPKNVRIVCRTVDITDPADLEKCSIEDCGTVIISPTEDIRTIKTLLAVTALLHDTGSAVRVNAIIVKNEYRFPPSLAEKNNITALQTNNTIAKMIAHSCTQTGLCETFREVFDFKGCDLFLTELPDAAGMTFGELSLSVDRAVPVGLGHAGDIRLNPPPETRVAEGDRILVFSEERNSAILDAGRKSDPCRELSAAQAAENGETGGDTVIIGYNEVLPTILRELPEDVGAVSLAGRQGSDEERRRVEETAAERGLRLHRCAQDPATEDGLLEIARTAEHIVLLNDHGKEDEDADMENIFLLMSLRDIRARHSLSFNITAELRKEQNQSLIAGGDRTDFVVASSVSSLCLAQLAEGPELAGVFREILANEGNELYLKRAERFGADGGCTVRELRRAALRAGYVLLGYRTEEGSVFNPPLDAKLTLNAGDDLIVIGEK